MKLLKSDLFGQMTLELERGRQIVIRDTGTARWWLSRHARRLVAALHRRGVAHHDLAKELNWRMTPTGAPAFVDFQLATGSTGRGRVFRALAREELRHRR